MKVVKPNGVRLRGARNSSTKPSPKWKSTSRRGEVGGIDDRDPRLRQRNRPRDEKVNHNEMENLEVQGRVENPRDPEREGIPLGLAEMGNLDERENPRDREREESPLELEEMVNLDERENPQVLEEMGILDESERELQNGLESRAGWN